MKKNLYLNLFFLLAFCLTLTASVWQTRRAFTKYDIQQSTQLGWQATPKPLSSLLADSNFEPHYQAVRLEGYFLSNRDILIDNRFYQHRHGVEVVSPFMDQATGQIVLVNRGWIEKYQYEAKTATSSGKNGTKVAGLIDKIRSNPFILARHEAALTDWPALQLQLRPAAISAALNAPVASFQLRLHAASPYAFATSWQPVMMPWQKHVGYAVQWLLLAAASLCMLWIVNRKRNDDDNTIKSTRPSASERQPS